MVDTVVVLGVLGLVAAVLVPAVLYYLGTRREKRRERESAPVPRIYVDRSQLLVSELKKRQDVGPLIAELESGYDLGWRLASAEERARARQKGFETVLSEKGEEIGMNRGDGLWVLMKRSK